MDEKTAREILGEGVIKLFYGLPWILHETELLERRRKKRKISTKLRTKADKLYDARELNALRKHKWVFKKLSERG